MVFKRTFYPFMLSVGLAGGLFEPQAIRAANEPVQTTQEEDSLQKKWSKKKKKKPSIAESWQKIINFDWDQLNSHDEKNLIISALGTGFILSCLYMFKPAAIPQPVTTTPHTSNNKPVVPKSHKKIMSGRPADNRTQVTPHNPAQPSHTHPVATPPQQPQTAIVYIYANNAIQDKRALHIKAYNTTQDGTQITQQSGNALCGLYATHNALTVMEALTHNPSEPEHAIINHQQALRARLDTKSTSINPHDNWVSTTITKRKITIAKRYLEHLFRRTILQSKFNELQNTMHWWDRFWFNVNHTKVLTDPKSPFALAPTPQEIREQLAALTALAEIIATDVVGNASTSLEQLRGQLRQKYDTLNPQHQTHSWYAKKMQNIENMFDRIGNSHQDHVLLLPVDNTFWTAAKSYVGKAFPAESTELNGDNLNSGEILAILEALDKQYATAELSAVDNSPAHGRISVLDVIPNASDHTTNNIKRQMREADTFCHGFVIRTGGTALPTQASDEDNDALKQLYAHANGYSTHWICCVIYKPTRESAPRYYIIDSMNGTTSASPTIQRLLELLESPLVNQG